MDEIRHTIEKLIKEDEKVEFEDERHIDLVMELVRQVENDESIIKDEDDLINQLETKVQEPEE